MIRTYKNLLVIPCNISQKSLKLKKKYETYLLYRALKIFSFTRTSYFNIYNI